MQNKPEAEVGENAYRQSCTERLPGFALPGVMPMFLFRLAL
jgi:hypothetical protein